LPAALSYAVGRRSLKGASGLAEEVDMSKIRRWRKMTCVVISFGTLMLVSCGGADTTTVTTPVTPPVGNRPAWQAYLDTSNDQGREAVDRWLSRMAKQHGGAYPLSASGSGGSKVMVAMCMRWEIEGRPPYNEEMDHADSGWCPGLLRAYYTGASL
jgi:hypothetical protein